MEKEITLHDRLVAIQSSLKAPKDQYNNFGKYKYRSAENILEAVKPLLKEQNCKLTIMDEILMVGDRYYVKAIATISDGAQSLSVSGIAREADSKAGMDCSQITGAASSYARKYALNGLFAIDDTKDADALNTTLEYTERENVNMTPAPWNECPKDIWDKLVRMDAEGVKTKKGMTGLQYLKEKYYTNDTLIALFEGDVQMARDAKAAAEASLNDPNQRLV